MPEGVGQWFRLGRVVTIDQVHGEGKTRLCIEWTISERRPPESCFDQGRDPQRGIVYIHYTLEVHPETLVAAHASGTNDSASGPIVCEVLLE